MLSIQDAGTEIIQGNTRKFYVFAGSEYGIKRKYLDILSSQVEEVKECPNLVDLISFLGKRHLFSPPKTLYIIRYDENFISSLDNSLALELNKLKFDGTIVCIYEATKDVTKLDKFFPNNVVSMDKINTSFIFKYLRKDFPNLCDETIKNISNICYDYNHGYTIAYNVNLLPESIRNSLSEVDMRHDFGIDSTVSETAIKQGVASRNFKYLLSCIEKYSDSLDKVYYSMLSTLVELEKVKSNKFVDSNLRNYSNRWTLEDIYNMFMQTYDQLNKSRSITQDVYNSLVYLVSLMQFQRIPSIEVTS